MANTPSNMLPLGTKAPDFKLLDTTTNEYKALSELQGRLGTVIMFICNHCPFVKHLNASISQLAKKYQPKGINFIAISSNDVENYPQDSPQLMTLVSQEAGYTFPYLYDSSQEVAKAYDAACTPDFYLFDPKLLLVYRGQYDSSRPGNEIPVTGQDLKQAMDSLIDGTAISEVQKPSMGCNIKWKKAK
ncbi:thioredoxin family protein [Arenibacter sp. 6A1]|uniref:thioredoxin family protein n=1 Tax=Arenibacter sp. 6A1 TaxID=2720391 RepID=UPI0014456424|nr:thioredoxin family protein [Arenibacter sp. 6A1]NKI26248.1 thioredoxin family protein [Arenibacter sp. 6A1]